MCDQLVKYYFQTAFLFVCPKLSGAQFPTTYLIFQDIPPNVLNHQVNAICSKRSINSPSSILQKGTHIFHDNLCGLILVHSFRMPLKETMKFKNPVYCEQSYSFRFWTLWNWPIMVISWVCFWNSLSCLNIHTMHMLKIKMPQETPTIYCSILLLWFAYAHLKTLVHPEKQKDINIQKLKCCSFSLQYPFEIISKPPFCKHVCVMCWC